MAETDPLDKCLQKLAELGVTSKTGEGGTAEKLVIGVNYFPLQDKKDHILQYRLRKDRNFYMDLTKAVK